MIFPFALARRGRQGARPKITACIRVRLAESDYLSDTRYEFEALAPVARGTETDKIKGVTRDKNCGVDKHPLQHIVLHSERIEHAHSERIEHVPQ
ncbi:hypothetical protein WN51_13653 [Melipona quadrifasciata]|uniref:Uncharacterized protein n=1 Tax=Melipona quadrifasciata TaxID=166423 RepID=A0A0M9A010_9HYME|nr:hypothetical protein WN51_13653 [Melipona quadrifasciata]